MKALEAAVQRWSWTRAEAARQQRESAEADAERLAFQAIDWFDFVVVETIEFPEDEQFAMPDYLRGSMGSGGGVPTSVASSVRYPGAPPPPPPMPTAYNRAAVQSSDDMDMDMDMDMDVDDAPAIKQSAGGFKYQNSTASKPSNTDDDDDTTGMNIVSDYAPRIASLQPKTMTMIDPLSGKVLPVEDVGQHMRVQLIDPRWRVEQQRFQEKQRDTGFAEGSSIADNLRQFAQKRGDIFGSSEEGSTAHSSNSEQKVGFPCGSYIINLSYVVGGTVGWPPIVHSCIPGNDAEHGNAAPSTKCAHECRGTCDVRDHGGTSTALSTCPHDAPPHSVDASYAAYTGHAAGPSHAGADGNAGTLPTADPWRSISSAAGDASASVNGLHHDGV
jgi:hypothetical protein